MERTERVVEASAVHSYSNELALIGESCFVLENGACRETPGDPSVRSLPGPAVGKYLATHSFEVHTEKSIRYSLKCSLEADRSS